jgi:ribulose-5-phosphate 4-epimerase/fuculose-1-phosphate aldolase
MSKSMTAAEETRLRRDLAAAYRLAARFGWDDTLYTHFSVRLPSSAGQERFLLNPFGLMFDEVRASDLIVVNMQGQIVQGNAKFNPAGFTIHSAVHMARDDAQCVIHTHTLAGMAVAACERGLLQLNQISAEFHEGVGYHAYEGVATNLEERNRIQAALGQKAALILRHHGLLSVGPTVADAFYVMYYLNRACEIQLACAQMAALGSLAGAVTEIKPAVSDHVRQQLARAQQERPLIWAAWLRQLERTNASYKN